MSTIEHFIESYSPQYGDKTQALIEALKAHDDKVALLNPFLLPTAIEYLLEAPLEQFLGQSICEKAVKPEKVHNLMSHYFLDRSSLLAPLLLPLSSGMKVLDMCAAPGGKLLTMLYRRLDGVSFVANELSSARALRLKKVMADYIPTHLCPSFAHKDGSLIGLKQPEHYDAVLLDAPCSSEAHVVKDAELLKKFTGLRKTLPMRQYSLLCSAILATKKGGHIMYATCSINKNENEEVIKKVLKKKSDEVELVPLNHAPFGSLNEWGLSILPHQHQAGPAFLSLLKKISHHKKRYV